MARSSRRVQRRRVPGGLEERAGGAVRVLLLRQLELRDQRTGLSRAWRGNPGGRASAARPDLHRRGRLEQQQPDERDASGQPITDPRIGQPFGAVGSPLAQSPPFEASARIRYDFPINDYNAFWQFGGQRQAHSISATSRTSVPNQPGYAYDEPGFSTYDASLGVGKGGWVADLYGENITNVQADLYENPNQFVDAKTVNRPRTFGLKLTYKF